MKLKSLLFGSAAVLAAGTGAQAADLPTVEPVEYVRICDAFGTGFYYIPGTDTCLRVGGQVRVETRWLEGDENDFNQTGADVADDDEDEEFNNYSTMARGSLRMDARTQSEFGLIRAFFEYEMEVGTSGFTAEGNGGGDGVSANDSGTDPNLASAFIQVSNDWGTYTAGHTGSFFDFWGSHGYGGVVNIDDNTGEQTLFAWTFAGGNGFSFTLSAEDPASGGRRLNGDDDYEGQEFPDGVANIRVDQGWGSAQVMGAVRHISETDGDGLGFAVGAGLSIGIPGGWTFDSQGGFADGALAYITSDQGPESANGPSPGRFGIGDLDGDDGDETNEAWMVRAGITGPIFSPNVIAWLDGSFTHAEEDDGNDEYDWWAVKAGFEWQPAPGLTWGPQFTYAENDGDDDGAEDAEIWQVMMRLNRAY
jgi:hypothetical protein